MAFLEKRSRHYRVVFTFQGQRYTHAVHTRDKREADLVCSAIATTILQIHQRLLLMPQGANIKEFIVKGGPASCQMPAARPAAEPTAAGPARLVLAHLFAQYLAAIKQKTVSPKTLIQRATFLARFESTVGPDLAASELTRDQLQGYVSRRLQDQSRHGRRFCLGSIHAEIACLRTAWNWGLEAGLVLHPFPSKGLKFPLAAEPLPFQTRAQIERRIALGGQEANHLYALWDSLFLTPPEIEELLGFVKTRAKWPWIYPLFCCAAHTGARLGEVLRAQQGDLDLEGGSIHLEGGQGASGRRVRRRLPLSGLLTEVLRGWLAIHPGGPCLFAKDYLHLGSCRIKVDYASLSEDEAIYYFRETLTGSKWQVLRGWHVLRQSFCCCCASQGTDLRLLTGWLGTRRREMLERCRHLIPHQEQAALQSVFG